MPSNTHWIIMRTDLAGDPAVLFMASKLHVRTEVVVGYLHAFWSWCDANIDDGTVTGVTLEALGEHLGLAGFPELLLKAGWLKYDNSHELPVMTIPNWDAHMSQSAKKRAKKAAQQRSRREAKLKPKSGFKSASTEQNRTEQKNTSKKSKPKESFRKPTVDEVRDYCQQRQNAVDPERFVDFYEAQGWKLSNGNAMKNWQSAVRNWERNAHGAAPGSEDAIVQANAGIEQRRRERAKRQAQYAAEDANAIRPRIRKA